MEFFIFDRWGRGWGVKPVVRTALQQSKMNNKNNCFLNWIKKYVYFYPARCHCWLPCWASRRMECREPRSRRCCSHRSEEKGGFVKAERKLVSKILEDFLVDFLKIVKQMRRKRGFPKKWNKFFFKSNNVLSNFILVVLYNLLQLFVLKYQIV